MRGAEFCELKGITILISGGAGSIAVNLPVFAQPRAAKVIVLDNSEFNLISFHKRLRKI